MSESDSRTGIDGRGDMVVLRPRRAGCISRGRTALSCGEDGFIKDGDEHGLWVYETRLLSRQRWLVDGRAPQLVTASMIRQHEWLGYFIAPPPGSDPERVDAAQQTLELCLRRMVGEGLREEMRVTNYTQSRMTFSLTLDVDADFKDWIDGGGDRRYCPAVTRRHDDERRELSIQGSAEHGIEDADGYDVQRVQRSVVVRVESSDVPPQLGDDHLTFRIELEPRARFHSRVTYAADIDGVRLSLPRRADPSDGGETRVTVPGASLLPRAVAAAFDRARQDLYALRLDAADDDVSGSTPAAGVPGYLGLFGRDSLITGWQAMLVDPRFATGALAAIGRCPGTRIDDFRDEQPDKLVHEIHRGPVSSLGLTPHGRYYGGVSSTLEYPSFVASLWHWTGDEPLVRRFLPTALRALRWAANYGDLDGDGFQEYRCRSPQGGKNQGWKDSGDAIVYPDGSQVPDPIGMAEMQGALYASLASTSELLCDLGETDTGKELVGHALELRKRFNAAFWMPREGFYAMGMDANNDLIRSIASNGAHALPTGIADDALVGQVADRLFRNDLFSGWGIRTLSASHPAYNPWSYHRGSVWPAENAFIVYGLARWGLHEQAHRLARAQFEAAALFEHHRLPELFAGHPRDAEHPFPAVYPRANSPQSWSASAIALVIRALLGLSPYAPLDVLLVDPHLPEWLPELTLHGLRVGRSSVTIRFRRGGGGRTDFDVLESSGGLRVVRSDGAMRSFARAALARAVVAH